MVHGRSLLGHTIEQARAAQRVSRVIVSTDDAEIADHAKDQGAEVPCLRPKEFATDDAPARLAYLHVCDWLQATEGHLPPAFAVTQPTSPLRLPLDIDEAIAAFERERADVVVSVTESPHPIRWTLTLESGRLSPLFSGERVVANRQAYDKTYTPNGAVFVFRTEYLRTHSSYYEGSTAAYVMPRERSIDIDDESDLEMARYFLEKRAGEST